MNKQMRIGSLFINSELFADEANKTVGEAAFSVEIIKNRRNVTSRMTEEGKEHLKKVKARLQEIAGKSGRIFFKWSKHCGCTMCPCSPGFMVYLELSDELSRSGDVYFKQLRESERFDVFLSEDGKMKIHQAQSSWKLSRLDITIKKGDERLLAPDHKSNPKK